MPCQRGNDDRGPDLKCRTSERPTWTGVKVLWVRSVVDNFMLSVTPLCIIIDVKICHK